MSVQEAAPQKKPGMFSRALEAIRQFRIANLKNLIAGTQAVIDQNQGRLQTQKAKLAELEGSAQN